jgi:CRP-like cAMP-binding protein|tara:strand:+ start:515 stop:1081 length:567 start_codon:yes stop_codon:yes gene_type:complete
MFNITPKIQVEINEHLPVLQTLGERRAFKKGDVIFREGDRPDHLLYLTEGVVKSYYLSDGKEVILRLMSKNSAAFSYSAFITGSPSVETIECIRDCEGIRISLSDLDEQRKNHPWVDLMLRYMAEQHYLSMERRLIMLHHKSLEQRYCYFLDVMDDEIVENTPMHCVASYLGVTPESFSRMKRHLERP